MTVEALPYEFLVCRMDRLLMLLPKGVDRLLLLLLILLLLIMPMHAAGVLHNVT